MLTKAETEWREELTIIMTQKDHVPLDSDVLWPFDESVQVSLVLDISSNSEVLSLSFKEVGLSVLLLLFSGTRTCDDLSYFG